MSNAGSPDQIRFNIAGAGLHTINLLSALPAITDAVVLDATTQPGFAGAPIIELNGAAAGAGADGLTLLGGNSTVRGLVINRFGGSGIHVGGTGGNLIQGNYVGLDATGNADLGNAQYGIWVTSDSNVIGGTTAGDRNVISGNNIDGIHIDGASGNLVQGNYVGTNATGYRSGRQRRGWHLAGQRLQQHHRRHRGGRAQRRVRKQLVRASR